MRVSSQRKTQVLYMTSRLFTKYNRPGSRYTVYPTIPYWDPDSFSKESWVQSLTHSLNEYSDEGISLYIHLPFCDSLCTFCGCNKRITLRHEQEMPYIRAVLKEWHSYLNIFPKTPSIKEIHLGGGTPTFFSMDNLKILIEGILEPVHLAENPEFSFEAHPKSTSRTHLHGLYNLGFRRISLGVQDYDKSIQLALNRVQPLWLVKRVHDYARELGYTINHDLIYGLPNQTIERNRPTLEITESLKPDRIAFYSYAHVPWRKGVGQRAFDELDLPKNAEKRAIFEAGRQFFKDHGYKEVGIDHFVLPGDELAKAAETGRMRRTLNGYSTTQNKIRLGLGMSSISESGDGFAQNTLDLEEYQQKADSGELPLIIGHISTTKDQLLARHINELMCYFETDLPEEPILKADILSDLKEMQEDEILIIDHDRITVTETGRPFVRNVCMAFDQRMKESSREMMFSQTV